MSFLTLSALSVYNCNVIPYDGSAPFKTLASLKLATVGLFASLVGYISVENHRIVLSENLCQIEQHLERKSPQLLDNLAIDEPRSV